MDELDTPKCECRIRVAALDAISALTLFSRADVTHKTNYSVLVVPAEYYDQMLESMQELKSAVGYVEDK